MTSAPATPKSANDIQVAGTHYRAEYQHWDWVNDNDMPYLLGAATKYIVRHRGKKGRQDLEKALHFIVKAAECAQANKLRCPVGVVDLQRLIEANQLDVTQATLCRILATWFTEADLRAAAVLLTTYMDACYGNEPLSEVLATPALSALAAPEPGSEAGPGYVNQDR